MYELFVTIISFCFLVKLQAEICTMDEFSRGEWVYNSKKTEKDFLCCSNITKNMSAEMRSACAEQRYSTKYCDCDIRDETLLTINEREKWEWVPSHCEALEYTPKKMCELMGDKIITIVGDSIAGETIHGIQSYLHTTPCASNNIRAGGWKFSSRIPRANGTEPRYNAVNGMLEHRSKIDIAIMNFGAWYQNLSMIEEATNMVMEDITAARKSNMTSHVQYIWRTNTVPHKNCMEYHKPYASSEVPADSPDHPANYSRYFPGHEMLEYNWHLFPLYNEYAKFAMHSIHVPWMDISQPLALRPDMHMSDTDCLHSCLPGPLDHIFNRMLMHYLYHYDSYKYSL